MLKCNVFITLKRLSTEWKKKMSFSRAITPSFCFETQSWTNILPNTNCSLFYQTCVHSIHSQGLHNTQPEQNDFIVTISIFRKQTLQLKQTLTLVIVVTQIRYLQTVKCFSRSIMSHICRQVDVHWCRGTPQIYLLGFQTAPLCSLADTNQYGQITRHITNRGVQLVWVFNSSINHMLLSLCLKPCSNTVKGNVI